MTSIALPFAGGSRQFVAGEWVASRSTQSIPVENPATGEIIAEIAAGGAEDVAMAVAAAGEAIARRGAARFNPVQRQEALFALARAIEAEAEDFAAIETLDAGKPISNTRRIDVPAAAAILRYFGGWATKLSGETMELSQPGEGLGFTLREPVGVVGQIIPWNYPLMGAAFKIGPAIAAGCAVVLKPAEQSSLSALKLAELTAQCGFPPGYVNLVTGLGNAAGAALVEHPDVAKISFTGSTATGREIAARCAHMMKRVTVELGGKSPVIVMGDANLDLAARNIAMNIFLNSGQTCSAGSRLLVDARIADELVDKVAQIANAMVLGRTDDEATQLGPVISQAQRERITAYVDGAIAEGARASRSGRQLPAQGHYVEPTVLSNVQPGMRAVDEEIFGPVLCAMPFETGDLDEIAALANDSAYGLAGYVFTSNLDAAHGLVARLKAGTVRVNTMSGADLSMPAGGFKQSGFGRENGRAGVEAYTELKSVTMAFGS